VRKFTLGDLILLTKFLGRLAWGRKKAVQEMAPRIGLGKACLGLGVHIACYRTDADSPRPCRFCTCDFQTAPPEILRQISDSSEAGTPIIWEGRKLILVERDFSYRSNYICLAPGDQVDETRRDPSVNPDELFALLQQQD
jgi:hypothetical protein